ncbi:putative RNA-binding protein [Leptomonas pyrrhocoris]|uniref:Putative RNA-binding protein n=1 Tax=Leptomonas pyrrhocoris TaxID=157538 RepID=A0A0M9G360_LEPPY|nr:putative RNA-binding protein [Leptomonas pyrrhocoris]KPA81196.1 putative RNA-binding protein [Leptomonas pyrrhocoris]|eukprot:XP_015659635.1 putative RNA-binding protein [Leptomonas pyrrhocoris]
MQSRTEDAQRLLVYINGTPYVASPVHPQDLGPLQQVFMPLSLQPPQQQQQQQDAMPANYILAAVPHNAGPAGVTLVPTTPPSRVMQQGALTSSQVFVLHPGQTLMPVHASVPRVADPDGGQPPSYRAVEPVGADALSGLCFAALPPSSLGAASTSGSSASATGPDTSLPSLPSTARQSGDQCLRRLSIHQRGAARLFVGQIHYDATEDDLYQIFTVYGHVLDVKIIRSGDTGAPAAAATTAATVGAVILRPDPCNVSTYLNPPLSGSGSYRIGSLSSSGLPPTAPPMLSTAVLTATTAPAVHPPTTPNSTGSNPTLSPQKANRRCSAFVTFSSMIEADTAISALHGWYVMGRDRPLQVTYCQATENISQFGFAHAVRLHKENTNNPMPLKSGTPTHR